MNDTDYIRKAVELANGFAPEALQVSTTENLQVGFEEQFFLDALAAQLVRQVDAIPHKSVDSQLTKIQIMDWAHETNMIRHIERGPDRTMNTIKAIVDSKVLDID